MFGDLEIREVDICFVEFCFIFGPHVLNFALILLLQLGSFAFLYDVEMECRKEIRK